MISTPKKGGSILTPPPPHPPHLPQNLQKVGFKWGGSASAPWRPSCAGAGDASTQSLGQDRGVRRRGGGGGLRPGLVVEEWRGGAQKGVLRHGRRPGPLTNRRVASLGGSKAAEERSGADGSGWGRPAHSPPNGVHPPGAAEGAAGTDVVGGSTPPPPKPNSAEEVWPIPTTFDSVGKSLLTTH